ncbi:MAG TPA: ABC transporter ATP-binding protein [Fimbriimonadaceae bacterium]|nr:ABC transporter ATP-binding protein [Fimbriimonadaceae bacterium]
MADTAPVVSLRHASKVYRTEAGDVHALKDVTLDLFPGEMVVILGPSGCGKTTLLNVVGGLDAVTSGEVVIDGTDIAAFTEAELTRFRRERIGFVFQFFNLVPTLTASENVLLAAELVKKPRDVDQVLREVGLGDRGVHFPAELSGGEQQRVAIARGLVKNPPILLCDEPTGDLDFETGRKILVLLHALTHEINQTVLLVTHNVAISKMADRIIRLRSGEVISDEHNENPLDPAELEW